MLKSRRRAIAAARQCGSPRDNNDWVVEFSTHGKRFVIARGIGAFFGPVL
jgi:hypothetical protein